MNVLNTDSGDVIDIAIVHPVSSHRMERDILIEKGAFRDKDYRLEWNSEDPFLSIAKGDPESIWHWLDYCNGYQQSLKDCIRIRQNWLSPLDTNELRNLAKRLNIECASRSNSPSVSDSIEIVERIMSWLVESNCQYPENERAEFVSRMWILETILSDYK